MSGEFMILYYVWNNLAELHSALRLTVMQYKLQACLPSEADLNDATLWLNEIKSLQVQNFWNKIKTQTKRLNL